ncbi:MAG: VacJ family lipoprotein [Pseudomonadota bacterium]
MSYISKFVVVSFLAVVSACAAPADGELVADPIEPVNRVFHVVNKGLDTVALRPASKVYAAVTPSFVERRLENVISHLALPADTLNSLLQGRTEEAGMNFSRFMVNTVLGIGGLFDMSTDLGVVRNDTDFGETLSVWGMGEGFYVELPLFGPNTARSTLGLAVDFVIDPLSYAPIPNVTTRTAFRVVEVIDLRDAFGAQIDAALYESEDSYSTTKNSYIQARRRYLERFEERSEDDFIDIYEE